MSEIKPPQPNPEPDKTDEIVPDTGIKAGQTPTAAPPDDEINADGVSKPNSDGLDSSEGAE